MIAMRARLSTSPHTAARELASQCRLSSAQRLVIRHAHELEHSPHHTALDVDRDALDRRQVVEDGVDDLRAAPILGLGHLVEAFRGATIGYAARAARQAVHLLTGAHPPAPILKVPLDAIGSAEHDCGRAKFFFFHRQYSAQFIASPMTTRTASSGVRTM